MRRLPSPSMDASLSVPEFMEKSCQNNWNPQTRHETRGDSFTVQCTGPQVQIWLGHRTNAGREQAGHLWTYNPLGTLARSPQQRNGTVDRHGPSNLHRHSHDTLQPPGQHTPPMCARTVIER